MSGIMKKNDVIDYLRCMAAIFVVFIHASNIFSYMSVDGVNIFTHILFIISNTAVPIFFLISGYLTFSKQEIDYMKHYKKKLKSLVLPYIIWIIIYLIFNIILNILNLDSSHTFKDNNIFMLLIGIPFYTNPILYEPLWFLRDLIFLNILVPLFDKIFKRINFKIIVIVLLILLFIPMPLHIFHSLYFVLGGLLARNNKMKSLIQREFSFIKILILCFLISFVKYKFQDIEILNRIVILIYIYFIYVIAKKTVNYKLPKIFIASVTPYSFWIYLTHGKLLSTFQVITSKLFYQNEIVAFLGYFILPIITIIICLLVGMLIKKFIPKVFNVMLGNRN